MTLLQSNNLIGWNFKWVWPVNLFNKPKVTLRQWKPTISVSLHPPLPLSPPVVFSSVYPQPLVLLSISAWLLLPLVVPVPSFSPPLPQPVSAPVGTAPVIEMIKTVYHNHPKFSDRLVWTKQCRPRSDCPFTDCPWSESILHAFANPSASLLYGKTTFSGCQFFFIFYGHDWANI